MRWSRMKKANSEGRNAIREATEHLAEDQARWPEVTRVASSLRAQRMQNHFVDRIAAIFEGK